MDVSHNLNAPPRLPENEKDLFALKNLEAQLLKQRQKINILTTKLIQKDKTLKELRNLSDLNKKKLQKLELQLSQIRSSRGWRLLRCYYVPRYWMIYFTKHPIEILSRFWRFLTHNALQSARQKPHDPSVIFYPTINPLILPNPVTYVNENKLPLIDKNISVVIPTKNAGRDFALLLKKLKSQEGLRDGEIIIVDSGSTDDTLEIAAKAGVHVIQIPPDAFTHAYARNKGAEFATGDYILFMVQDALPLSNTWMWEMAKTLEQNGVVAVSCAEYPRSDCDLFYRFISWNHYRTMNLDKDRFMIWDESCESHFGRRSNGQISNIAALIRSDIFNQYRFRTKYAEDLDLGIRLIKNKHKIGFLYHTRVLHSHNRSAYYFLKRSYVDTKFLKELFDDFEYPSIDNIRKVYQEILSLYFRTRQITFDLATRKSPEKETISNLFDGIHAMYLSDHIKMEVPESEAPDREMEDFIRALAVYLNNQEIVYEYKKDMLLTNFLHHLRMLQAYVSQSMEYVGEPLMRDLIPALYKLTALQSGAYIGHLYLTLSRRAETEWALSALDKILVSDV